MIYKWKFENLFPVDPQKAGEELNRIYQERGALNPSDIVEESKDENAPLHPCFEWNDTIAANKYREGQAATIVRAIITEPDIATGTTEEVRAFVHVQATYRPIQIVVDEEAMMQELLESALRELSSFQKKYSTLSALNPVFEAIRRVS